MTNQPEPTQLDPVHGDPRELMRLLLPAARAAYLKAWELLADPAAPLERRRLARSRAASVADDHAVVAQVLRGRESSLKGNDLHNARHLADELERHAEALGKLATMPAMGALDAAALRPEALGCGKRYRMPDRTSAEGGAASRAVSSKPTSKARDPRDQRQNNDPFRDRGPKVDRGALGTSKHDSPLGDDLDEVTRAKLEAMRRELES